MGSMQESFFGWTGYDWILYVPNVFVTEKEHDFKTDENIALLHLGNNKKSLFN